MAIRDIKITAVKAVSFRQMVSKLAADSKAIKDPVVSIKDLYEKQTLEKREKIDILRSINCITVQSSASAIIRFGQNLWKKKNWKCLTKEYFMIYISL